MATKMTQATFDIGTTMTVVIDGNPVEIDLPFRMTDGDLTHGPYVSDDGNRVSFARWDRDHEHEWGCGVEVESITGDHTEEYRTRIMLERVRALRDGKPNPVVPIDIDHRGPYTVAHALRHRDASRGERWTHVMTIDHEMIGSTDPWEIAESELREFNAVAEGDVFGVVHLTRDERNESGWAIDECWGYVGSDWADQACKEGH